MKPVTSPRLVFPVSGRDHIKGPINAPITLVEYGDFQCPYCGQAYTVVKEMEQSLKDLMRFAFRNFPLTNIHHHAKRAAEAAEAARAQGRFWQMHDTLFENQRALGDPHLLKYAEMIGLDREQYIRDMTEHRYSNRVHEDFLSGVQSGVDGTPTFFINGARYKGSYDLDSLLAGIEEAIEARRL